MNSNAFRSLAVLCLLVLAPCARALSITQTDNFSSDSATLNVISWKSFSLSKEWDFAQYNGSAPLTSVQITLTVTGVASAVELDPFKTGAGTTLNLALTAGFVFSAGGYFFGENTYASASGYREPGITFSAPFAMHTVLTLTNPVEVAQFIGAGTQRIASGVRLESTQQYGGQGLVFNATTTVRYNVPDNASTGILALIAAVGLFLVSHLMAERASRR